MTTREAIDLLDNLIGMVEDNQGNDYDGAIHKAIRSLEAWDSLVKEMEEEMYYYDTMPDVWYGISESFDIIKKHLKKVEDEQVH